MSTANTTEAPAIKKRGRPKKVVTEDAGTIATPAKTTGVRSASTKSPAPKEKVEKAKKAPARTKTTTKKDAPKPTTSARPTTPVAPPKSTVLDNAKVTEAIEAAEKDVKPPKPAATQQPTPITPTTSRILDQVRATGTLQAKPTSSKPPTTPRPAQSQSQSQAAKPTTFPLLRPSQRTTTIPLPSSPLRAPSPKQAAPASRPAFAAPAAPGNPRPRSRIIEPTPDIRLPPKYKPAARRVTAIIVGIPIILVFGWELYGRWKGEVRKKWSDGGERL